MGAMTLDAAVWRAPAVERPDGSLTAPERELLQGYLNFYRTTLLFKCAGLTAEQLTVRTTVVTAEISGSSGSRWTYTTVIADAPEQLETVPNRESSELRWVAEEDVAGLPLHPGFAASWERLRVVTASIPLLVNPPR